MGNDLKRSVVSASIPVSAQSKRVSADINADFLIKMASATISSADRNEPHLTRAGMSTHTWGCKSGRKRWTPPLRCQLVPMVVMSDVTWQLFSRYNQTPSSPDDTATCACSAKLSSMFRSDPLTTLTFWLTRLSPCVSIQIELFRVSLIEDPCLSSVVWHVPPRVTCNCCVTLSGLIRVMTVERAN